MLYCMLYNIIYPVEIEIKDTTDADHHASYLDLLLKYDNSHRLQVKLYDKRDDFDFDIVNFLFLRSNIPQSPGYGVFVLNLFGMPAPPLCMTISLCEVNFWFLNYQSGILLEIGWLLFKVWGNHLVEINITDISTMAAMLDSQICEYFWIYFS